MDSIRRLAMHLGWQRAAVIALIALAFTLRLHGAVRSIPRGRPAAAEEQQAPAPPAPHREPTASATNIDESWLSQYEDVVRVHGPDDQQLFLLTSSWPNAQDGIRCVDAVTGRLKWHRDPADQARYTVITAGVATLAECTGYPQENTLAVRRLSDGRILGHPWKVARIFGFAISGRRVAAIVPVIIQRGREVPEGSLGDCPEGQDATRVRVFDEWGHALSSMRLPNAISLTGFPRGFAVVSDAGTTLLTSSGHLVRTLR
jgi:hypothetical protein